MKEKHYLEDNNLGQNIFSLIANKKEEKNIINEIKILEKKNIDLSQLFEDKNKNTLLISSVYHNLKEVSIYLIDYFRNELKSSTQFLDYLNLRNIKGYDALLYSAYRGNYEIFQKLLENGAYLNTCNITGLNALHLSAQGNCPNIITALMEKYIFNINSQDNHGNTALHWAVYFNNQQCIDYLLYYNIDINIIDENQCTAMDLAIKRENIDLIDKLKTSFAIYYSSNRNNKSIKNFFSKDEIILIWLGKYIYIAVLVFLFLSELYNQKLVSIVSNNHKINFIFILFFILQILLYYFLNKVGQDEKNNSKESLMNLLNQGNDMNNICPWCSKGMRNQNYHCPYCKKCISHQEFHNSLLNICISKTNFKFYLIFLSFLTIVFILKSFAAIYCIIKSEKSLIIENKYTFFFDIIINFNICGLCIYRFIKKMMLFKTNKPELGWKHTLENNHYFPEFDNKISMN